MQFWKQSGTLKIKNVKKSRIKKITFKSNKKSVARVSSKGKVTGVKMGKAVITCKLVLKSGKKYTLKCKVTVRKKGSPKGKAVVYMTKDISSDGLMAVYEALGASPKGKVAVKISTGEPGSNYLKPDLIGDLVKSLDGTIVECNTAYGGDRASTAMHYQVAKDHRYTAIADVDIMDEKGSMTLTHSGGTGDDMWSAEDGAKLVKRIESRNGLHTLEHAEKVGLGSGSTG